MVDNIKVKHLPLDIYRKNISLMKINNIILVLCTRIILLSSFVIYFFTYVILEVFLLYNISSGVYSMIRLLFIEIK